MYFISHIPTSYKIKDITDIIHMIKIGTRHAHKNLYSHIVIERIGNIEFKKIEGKILSAFVINNIQYSMRQRPQEEIANIFREKLFPTKLI